MKSDEALELLLHSYEQYYNVNRNKDVSPFSAEAEFHSHNEQYFLVHSAKLSSSDSNEYVYFASAQNLSLEKLHDLDELAWKKGIEKIVPYFGHRNSDISLIILADSVDLDAFKSAKKIKRYKSYKFSFWGWTHYKVCVMDLSSKKISCNRFALEVKRLLAKVLA